MKEISELHKEWMKKPEYRKEYNRLWLEFKFWSLWIIIKKSVKNMRAWLSGLKHSPAKREA